MCANKRRSTCKWVNFRMARRIVCTRTLRSKILFDGGPYNTIRSFVKRNSSHDSVASVTAATDPFKAANNDEIAGPSPHTQTTHSGFSFDDAESAYQSKTSWEIVRALAIFRLCSYDFLVNKNKEVWQSFILYAEDNRSCRHFTLFLN